MPFVTECLEEEEALFVLEEVNGGRLLVTRSMALSSLDTPFGKIAGVASIATDHERAGSLALKPCQAVCELYRSSYLGM